MWGRPVEFYFFLPACENYTKQHLNNKYLQKMKVTLNLVGQRLHHPDRTRHIWSYVSDLCCQRQRGPAGMLKVCFSSISTLQHCVCIPSWTRDTEILCLFADYWWSPMWSNNVVNMNLSTVHRTKSLCDDGGRKVARMKTMLGPNLLMSPTVGAQHGALSRLSVTSHNNWYSNKITI